MLFDKKIMPVMIIPTGLGCTIGGHAGDATPAAKCLAAVSDLLLVHPNVVNASDFNEMASNMLYVEGSMLDRFLEGQIEGLEPVHNNRILLAVNKPAAPELINACYAARTILGARIQIMELAVPLEMKAILYEHHADGAISGHQALIDQTRHHNFDALGIATEIQIEEAAVHHYYQNGGVNPWGGVEAKLSKEVSEALNLPVAHSPLEGTTSQNLLDLYKCKVVDARIAPEIISATYVFCMLKGLQKAPQIGRTILAHDITCLISPVGCLGRAHRACAEKGIPIVYVKENQCGPFQEIGEPGIVVANYLEAAGYLATVRAGISWFSVKAYGDWHA